MQRDRRRVNRKERMHERIRYITLALRNRFRRQSGQTLTEYAVLLAFIAVLVAGAVVAFGEALKAYWLDIVHKLTLLP